MKSFVFSYTPKKLISITEKIKEVFPSSKNLQAKKVSDYKNVDIEDLLRQIKNTKEDQLRYFARSLKNHDLYSLVYNLEKIEDDILNKVITILICRNKERLVKVMWKNYCQSCNNQFIINYFKRTIEHIEFMKFTDLPYKYINDIFENNPTRWLANHFYHSDASFFNSLQEFNIIQDSKLAYQIGLNLFTIPNKKVFRKEEADTLCNIFSSYKIKSLINIIENYLEIHEINEFNNILMTFVIDRLGIPTEESNLFWQDIKSSAHQKARQWYIEKELTSFFDSLDDSTGDAKRRFNYWRKYIDYIKDVRYKPGNSQLFLVFNKFAVIEFGKVGNAAYIYRRDVFDRLFAKYMKKGYKPSNSILRNNNNIHRIIHSGNWERLTDIRLKKWNLL